MGLPGEVIVGVALVPRLFTRNRNKHGRENGSSDGKAVDDDEERSPNPDEEDEEERSPNAADEDDDGDGALSDSGSARGGFSLRRSATYMSFVNARRGLRRKRAEEEDGDQDDAATAPVNRWAPVFAGLCCPFSILLEIPGLTERWYIRCAHPHSSPARPGSDTPAQNGE